MQIFFFFSFYWIKHLHACSIRLIDGCRWRGYRRWILGLAFCLPTAIHPRRVIKLPTTGHTEVATDTTKLLQVNYHWHSVSFSLFFSLSHFYPVYICDACGSYFKKQYPLKPLILASDKEQQQQQPKATTTAHTLTTGIAFECQCHVSLAIH